MESGGAKEMAENDDNQSGSPAPHFPLEGSVTKFHVWFTRLCCKKQSILKSWSIKTKRVFINLWCYASILSGCREQMAPDHVCGNAEEVQRGRAKWRSVKQFDYGLSEEGMFRPLLTP